MMRKLLATVSTLALLVAPALAQPNTNTGPTATQIVIPNPVVASGAGSLAQGINTSGHAVNAADSVVVQKHSIQVLGVAGATGAQSPTLVNQTNDQ